MNHKKFDAPRELRVALSGDRRVAENLVLEVRAIAQRCGLEISEIQILGKSKVSSKTIKQNKLKRVS